LLRWYSNPGGRQPDVLQQVTVQIQSNAECKKNYGKDAPGGIVDHMICAAYPGKDSCSVRKINYFAIKGLRLFFISR
jgi:hypothetical protein